MPVQQTWHRIDKECNSIRQPQHCITFRVRTILVLGYWVLGNIHRYLVPLETCTLTDAIVCLDTMLICCCLLNTIVVIIIGFWDFLWSLLCYTLVSVLVLLEANIIGYWILGAFLGIVLTLEKIYQKQKINKLGLGEKNTHITLN